MPILPRAAAFLRTVFRGSALDRDLDEELRSALDELAARKAARGMPADEARRAARLELGGVEQVGERVRDGRTGAWFVGLVGDARYAWRGLWKSPGFALAAIATLALGIGANTTIFGLVHATLLRPLPYRDAGRLVFVWSDLTRAGYPRAPLAGPELADLRERTTLFSGIGGIWANTAALTGEGEPEQLRIGLVTTNFFSVLGADAALGRTFVPEDETPNAPALILLSWELWQRRYGGDRALVGRRILVNGAPATVVGVMPQGFRLWLPVDANVPEDLQAWRPLPSSIVQWSRGQQFLRVVARMRPGVTLAQADEEVAAVARKIGRTFPDYGQAPPTFYAVGLHADGVREVRPALLALFAGVTALLLMACVNVANLLLARAAGRRREIAMRVALGASRGRLVRQCLLDGLLLAALGAAAGIVVARVTLAVLLALRPDTLGRIAGASLDLRVLAFAGTTSLLWGLLFSLAPLAEIFRTDVSAALRHVARVTGSRFETNARSALVLVQVAMAVLLLVGAGLLVRTFVNLQRVEPGFRSEGALTFRVALPFTRLKTPQAGIEFARQLRAAIAALPGVESAGGTSHLPYDNLPNWSTPYLREDERDPSLAREADARAVTPGFFETVGAVLLEGRFFSDDDQAGKPFVAIVDARLAARTWPGESAVGKRLLTDPGSSGSPKTLVTVIGVVRHLRHRKPTEEVREQIYYPELQVFRSPMAYVLLAKGNPGELARPVRQAVARLDPLLPVYDIRPLDDYVAGARSVSRFTTLLAAMFAAVALALASVGVYGVLAYSVARRRQEFAIRLALGASRGNVLRHVLGEAGKLGGLGLLVGLGGALGVARLLQSQLYGVTPRDPLVFAVAVPVLAAAIAAASLLPARRAVGVDAHHALRDD